MPARMRTLLFVLLLLFIPGRAEGLSLRPQVHDSKAQPSLADIASSPAPSVRTGPCFFASRITLYTRSASDSNYAYCGGNPVNGTDPSGLKDDNRDFWDTLPPPPPGPRVIIKYSEGISAVPAAELMVGGLLVKDLYFLGRTVGTGFMALERTIATGPVQGAGKLIRAEGSATGTAHERAFASELSKTRHVVTRFELAGSDLVVDGFEWELKEVTATGADSLKSAIEGAFSQTGVKRAYIDASKLKYSDEFVEAQMNRIRGNVVYPGELIIQTQDTIYIYKTYLP